MKIQILATCLLFAPTFLSSPIPQVGAIGSTSDATLLNTLTTETLQLDTLTKSSLAPGTEAKLSVNAPLVLAEIETIVRQELAIARASKTTSMVSGQLSAADSAAVATALKSFIQATSDYLTTFIGISYQFAGTNFKYIIPPILKVYKLATDNLLSTELAKLDSKTSASFSNSIKTLDKLFDKALEKVASSRD